MKQKVNFNLSAELTGSTLVLDFKDIGWGVNHATIHIPASDIPKLILALESLQKEST